MKKLFVGIMLTSLVSQAQFKVSDIDPSEINCKASAYSLPGHKEMSSQNLELKLTNSGSIKFGDKDLAYKVYEAETKINDTKVRIQMNTGEGMSGFMISHGEICTSNCNQIDTNEIGSVDTIEMLKGQNMRLVTLNKNVRYYVECSRKN